MAPRDAVLTVIKAEGPITAKAIARRLNIPEKSARSRIHHLREAGEPIWLDPNTSCFWWSDDRMPGPVLYQRWKRSLRK